MNAPVEVYSVLFLNLLFTVFLGIVTAIIASNKGRNSLGWFLIGFLFNFLGLILVIVLSNLKEQQKKFNDIELEKRLLKEQLRQEQMKNESFRSTANTPLNAHDKALGLNTNPSGLPDSNYDIENKQYSPVLIECPNCRKMNSAGSQYCCFCAAFLGNAQI